MCGRDGWGLIICLKVSKVPRSSLDESGVRPEDAMPANFLFLLSIQLPSIYQHLGKHPDSPTHLCGCGGKASAKFIKPQCNLNRMQMKEGPRAWGLAGGRREQRVGSASTQKDSHGIRCYVHAFSRRCHA